MRELTDEETLQVSGGALGLATGALGALGGGLVAGGHYAVSHAGSAFSWGEFTFVVGSTAASGFLVGSGMTLIAGAATGALNGTAVLGVTLVGTGASIGVTAPLALEETVEKSAGS